MVHLGVACEKVEHPALTRFSAGHIQPLTLNLSGSYLGVAITEVVYRKCRSPLHCRVHGKRYKIAVSFRSRQHFCP